MVSVDDYNEVKDCIYKHEHYSVRDNGAVMRHQREGMRVRRDDNVWTFGKPNERTGYMDFCGQAVHRIVAFAFHGNPPSEQHVVDHIDTNRHNNRPENLRWLTRLENVLLNPITRSKIEYICGSIEAFLANPSMLRGHELDDSNFIWMRAVTPEEAQATLERQIIWAKERPKSQGGKMGEWIYKKKASKQTSYESKRYDESLQTKFVPKEDVKITRSLTSNAMQINWKTPSEFPCCPQETTNNPLEEYLSNLKIGSVFCKNDLNNSNVLKAALSDDGKSLYVITQSDGESMKPWALTKIVFQDNTFIHESKGTFFEEVGAKKYFILEQGKEWTGGDVFDDYC